MLRIPRALAALAGVALLASACGGEPDDLTADPAPTETADTETETETETAEPTETATDEAPVRDADADLVIWADENRANALADVAAQFGEENGITVAVQVVATDLQTNFVTANESGNGPDIVIGAHDWIGNLVQNGSIDPVALDESNQGNYSDIAIEGVTFNGQVYGLPYAVESLVLYRNTDLIPEAPQTIEELVAAGQEAVDAGTVDSALNLQVGQEGDAYHMQPLFTSAGGYLFGTTEEGDYDPTDVGVGEEGSLAAAERIFELGEGGSGVLNQSIGAENSIALFTEGAAASLVSGPWALNDVNTSGIPYEISPIPGFEGLDPAQPFTGVQAFFVASEGANKQFAQEFVVNAANTPETMQALYDADPRTPAMIEVLEAVSADDPNVAVFAEAAEGGQILPAIPEMAAIWGPLGQAEAAIVGGADPVETMTTAGETIVAEIG